MITFPNAKINLGLHVLRRRKDGYHDLETCFYPIQWNDVLEINHSDKLVFESSGLAIAGKSKDNLVAKAWYLLNKEFSLQPVQIHLHKVIPMGAGLGGGSSDASHALKMLNELFNLYVDDDILEIYAGELGSDCPFFVKNQPVLATGRGEVFESLELNLAGYHILVAHPGVHVGTKEAYAQVKPRVPARPLKEVLEHEPLENWKDCLVNDFEASVFAQFPEVAQLKETLYGMGAAYAAMSGSGSAVYGIFKEAPQAPAEWPGHYVVWQGQL